MSLWLLLGAIVMYEAAHRTGIEVTNDLQSRAVQYRKQRDFYLVSLICLKVCSHDYQWLVRPANNDKGQFMSVKNSANQIVV